MAGQTAGVDWRKGNCIPYSLGGAVVGTGEALEEYGEGTGGPLHAGGTCGSASLGNMINKMCLILQQQKIASAMYKSMLFSLIGAHQRQIGNKIRHSIGV